MLNDFVLNVLADVVLHRIEELHLVVAATHLFDRFCYLTVTFGLSLPKLCGFGPLDLVLVFCEGVVMLIEELQGLLELRRMDVHRHIEESRLLLLRPLCHFKHELGWSRLLEVALQKSNDLVELYAVLAVEDILQL